MNENIVEKLQNKKMKRRSFLKWSGAVAAPAIIAGAGVSTKLINNGTAEAASEGVEEHIIPTCGLTNCGGRCLVKAHVKDGTIVRISTDDSKEDTIQSPQMRACLRGRSYRQFAYNPDRLQYPMKRVGKRGEGKFERITWEEAIDTIYNETERITQKYGREAVYNNYASGYGSASTPGLNKLLALTGGNLGYYYSYSSAQAQAGTPYTYGTKSTGSSLDSLLNSKLIILWGFNPAEVIFGTFNFYLRKAKEAGAKIIVVDPRQSDSAVIYADEWIPLRPTTDNALMDAISLRSGG